MKNSDIFVAVISEPSFMSKSPIFGKPIGEYLADEIAAFPHAVFDCEKRVTRPKCKFFCLLYADMALVTEDMIVGAAEALKRRNIPSLMLGAGYIVRENAEVDPKYAAADKYFLRANDTSSVNMVYNEIRKRAKEKLEKGGVLCFGDAEADFTATIEPGAILCGNVKIKGNSHVCRGAKITDSVIENGRIGENSTVGPFAYVREGSEIGKNCRIGDFVEIKASKLGDGVKVAHLAYVGNAEVGDNVNVGCGAVFCNYDGFKKHKTVVGKGAFIGANVNLVAPLKVGDGAYIAAGSTVTKDLPDGAFCIERTTQQVKQKRKT